MNEEQTVTKLKELINPEVMADMISAKIEKKLKLTPFIKVDTTLQGNEGDTITIPKFLYTGDCKEINEGEEIPIRKLGVSSEQYTIKMVGDGIELTDMAVLSAHGNVVGEGNNQLGLSVAEKIESDIMVEALKSRNVYNSGHTIGYKTIVNAEDLFEEEESSQKIMLIHPKQATQLRLDPDFIDKSKYGNDVMMSGEIGEVSGIRIVRSKRTRSDEYYKIVTTGGLEIVADDIDKDNFNKEKQIRLREVLKVNNVSLFDNIPEVKVGNKVEIVPATVYHNPILKLSNDNETEDDAEAITIFLKRDTNVETERKSRKRLTEVTVDKIYGCALTNESKVVIAKHLATETVASTEPPKTNDNKEEGI